MNENDESLANIAQCVSPRIASERLGVPAPTFRLWIRKGKLKAYRIGKKFLVPVVEIERLLAENNYQPR
jgi:excisionase family DNA binding protein